MHMEIMYAKANANASIECRFEYESWVVKQKQNLLQIFNGNRNANHECQSRKRMQMGIMHAKANANGNHACKSECKFES